MAFDYSKLAQIAVDQIANFGRDVVLTREIEPTYNYDTGTNTAGIGITETIKAVVTDIQDDQTNGDTIRRGDLMYTIPAQGLDKPDLNDRIDGLKVLNVKTIQTGDTPLLYKVQVRV